MMCEIEANVRADLMGIGVVLNEGIDESPRRESVSHTRAHEGRGERSIRQVHLVAVVIEIDGRMQIEFQIEVAIE